MVKSVNNHTNVPNDKAVSKTPAVDNAIPSLSMGFTELQLVSKPPENKIKLRETMPINCASLGSSNLIPPMPSDPANIPIAKKSINVGTPNL